MNTQTKPKAKDTSIAQHLLVGKYYPAPVTNLRQYIGAMRSTSKVIQPKQEKPAFIIQQGHVERIAVFKGSFKDTIVYESWEATDRGTWRFLGNFVVAGCVFDRLYAMERWDVIKAELEVHYGK